jgi:hypothetical protein
MKLLEYRSFEDHVQAIFDLALRLAAALERAGIEYWVVGGLAVYVHVDQVDPEAARLTRDVDVAIARRDLERVAQAVQAQGLELRHAAGVDLLVDTRNPKNKRRVHFLFAGENVYPDDIAPIPELSAGVKTKGGFWIAPVADVVRMKLTSFRLKDKVHLQDLDGVGLITPEVEESLSGELRARLREVRAMR